MAAPLREDEDALSYTTVETTETTYSGDFATLTPDNVAAAAAFDSVVAFLEDGDAPSSIAADPYHAQFLSLELPSAPTEVHSPSSSNSSPPPTTIPSAAHSRYRLSLDLLPEGPAASWRIGRGSTRISDPQHGVDLLLVPPGQHKGYGVANVHALISIHRLSGAFMLRSTSSRPVIYLSAAEDGKDLVLRRGEQAVIYKTTNRLRIGTLDYLLAIGVEHESHFETLRNQFIGTVLEEPALPHPQLDVIPRPYHQKMAGYIIHKPISSGAFGMVRSAVESATGNPVAVKRISCRGPRDTSAVDAEMRIARLFPFVGGGVDDDGGIIPLLSAWCEHGLRPPCGKTPEDVFLAMPLARSDFGHTDWLSISMTTRLALFRCTLTGLTRIHSASITHRDISLKNLLVSSLQPPDAAICDFGKATDKLQSVNTAIGPIDTVAPEVWRAPMGRPYGPAIDIWSLGYAWLSTFGPLRRITSAAGDLRTDETRARGISRELDERIRAGKIPGPLGDLIRSMMEYQPEQRCTAAQALRHHVWDPPPDVRSSARPDEGHAVKRARLLTPDPGDVPPRSRDVSVIPDTECSPNR